MGINQLFIKRVPFDTLNKMSQLFNIDLIDIKKYTFTKKELINTSILNDFLDIKPILMPFYLPCKSKIYLQGINEKRAITILRQFIKVHNYSLYSKEKSLNGQKQTYYSLIYNNQTSLSPTKQEEKRKIVLTFDI